MNENQATHTHTRTTTEVAKIDVPSDRPERPAPPPHPVYRPASTGTEPIPRQESVPDEGRYRYEPSDAEDRLDVATPNDEQHPSHDAGDAGDADDDDDDDDDAIRPTSDPDEEPSKKSAATRIMELAHNIYEFHVDQDGSVYAIEIDGPNLARSIRGGRHGLKAELAAAYYRHEKKVAPAAALTDAITVLMGEAALTEPAPCALRLASHRDEIIIDVGDLLGRAVEVYPRGWVVRPNSPVTFKRTALTAELATPVRGGDINELRDLLNVTDASWPHLVGWLVAALIPDVPHPVLSLRGEMGSGKSTAASALVSLVDPAHPAIRSNPRNEHDWIIAAAGSWVIALDNISTIPQWLSDALCRAVTGEGSVVRKLYTDDDMSVIEFRRCVILTSIDPGALRGDLVDRLVQVNLQRIDPSRRRTDADLAAALDNARPRILGALLDLVGDVLEVLPSIELDTMPRMADYAKVLAAIDQVTGLGCLPRYLNLSTELMADVLNDDPVAVAIRKLLEREDGYWRGTATDLFVRLSRRRPPKGWPSDPRNLTKHLKNLQPALRTVGIDMRQDRTGRERLLILETVREPASSSSSASPQAPGAPPAADRGER